MLRPDGTVLIGHRIKRGESESWCLPGGHVEAGESFESAAVREIAEESGIYEVEGAQLFAVVLHTGAERTHVTAGVLVRLAAASAEAATPENDVFDRWAWARPGEFPVPLYPASAALIAAWRREPMPEGSIVYPTVRSVASSGGGQ